MKHTQGNQHPEAVIQIRDYRPGDEGGLSDLAEACFSELGPGGPDAWLREWRWKFTGCYLGEFAPSVAQLEDGRIVGHYGSMIRRFQVGRGYRKVGIPVDNMIAPEFRGGAIQRRLFEHQREFSAPRLDVPFGLGTPSPDAYVVGQRLLKYKNLTWIKCFYADLSPMRRLWRNRQWKRVPARDDLDIRPVDHIDERFDELWERLRRHYPCTEARTSDFLRWRYQEAPDRNYEILAAHGVEGIEGYIVLRPPLTKGEPARIVDLFAPPEPPILSTLLRAAVRRSASQARGIDFHVAANEIFYRTLVENGFFWTGIEIPVVFWQFTFSDTVHPRHFENPQRWYITSGLTDLI